MISKSLECSEESALAAVGPGEKYRLSRQVRAWDRDDPMVPQRRIAQAGVEYGLTQMVSEAWQPSAKPQRRSILTIVLIILGILGIGAMIGYMVYMLGVSKVSVAALSAMFPMITVVLTLFWLNRWSPEPRSALLVTFLWGAGVATSLSLVANTSGSTLFSYLVNPEFGEASAGALLAPLVEETFKGLGVIIVMLWRRRDIQSPLDGLVYGGFSAIGFAFTENILYFGRAESSFQLVFTFVLRAIMSPFTHALFTSLTGLALGVAITRMKSRWAPIWVTPVGLVSAMILHGLWNGLAGLGVIFFAAYFLLWIPGFIIWLTIAIVASVKQRRWIVTGLRPYVRAGWIHPSEANIVCSLSERSKERKRIRKLYGYEPARTVRRFHNTIAALALDWVTAQKTGVDEKRVNQAIASLDAIEAMRQQIMAPQAAPVKGPVTGLSRLPEAEASSQKIRIRAENS